MDHFPQVKPWWPGYPPWLRWFARWSNPSNPSSRDSQVSLERAFRLTERPSLFWQPECGGEERYTTVRGGLQGYGVTKWVWDLNLQKLGYSSTTMVKTDPLVSWTTPPSTYSSVLWMHYFRVNMEMLGYLLMEMLRIYWRSNTIFGEDVFLCHAKGWIKPIGDGGTWNQTDVERKSDDSSSVLGWAIALDDRPKRGPMLLLIQFSISTFHCCQNIVVVSTKVWSSESRKRRTSVCVEYLCGFLGLCCVQTWCRPWPFVVKTCSSKFPTDVMSDQTSCVQSPTVHPLTHAVQGQTSTTHVPLQITVMAKIQFRLQQPGQEHVKMHADAFYPWFFISSFCGNSQQKSDRNHPPRDVPGVSRSSTDHPPSLRRCLSCNRLAAA
jgi:hypothetical protein